MHVGVIGDFSHRQSVNSHIARLHDRIGATGVVTDLAQAEPILPEIADLDALVWVCRSATDAADGASAALAAAKDAGVPTLAWCPTRPDTRPDSFGAPFLSADVVAVTTSAHDDAWRSAVAGDLLTLPPATADDDTGPGQYRPHLPTGPVLVAGDHDPDLAAEIHAAVPGVTDWPGWRWLGGRFAAHVARTATALIVVDDHGPGRWSPFVPLLLGAGGRVIAAADDGLEDVFDCDIGTYRDVDDIAELVAVAEAHPDTDATRQRRVDAVLDGGHTHLARFVDLLDRVTT